jgi:hypothetical protein
MPKNSHAHLNTRVLREWGMVAQRLRDRSVEWADTLQVSRRRFLGISAAAAAGTPVKAVRLIPFAPNLRIRQKDNAVAISFGDEREFVIDGSRFAGSPMVGLHGNKDAFEVSLKGARFPGLQLVADLSLRAERALMGWAYELHLCGLDAVARGDLSEFLLDQVPARARTRTNVCLLLSNGLRLNAANIKVLEFNHDWTIRLSGACVAEVDSSLGKIQSDEVTLNRAERRSDLLLEQTVSPASQLLLSRGEYSWGTPSISTEDGSALDLDAEPFAQCKIDAVETEKGTLAALCFRGSETGVAARFRAHPHFPTDNGSAFDIPLSGLQFAEILETGEAYFSGSIPPEAPAISLGGMTYRFTDPLTVPAVEATRASFNQPLRACLKVAPQVGDLFRGGLIATAPVSDDIAISWWKKFGCDSIRP